MSAEVRPSSEPAPESELGLDALTGLPGRYHLMDALAAQERMNPGGFGLLFIDLDELKLKNDTFGHRVGDQYLRDSANVFEETAEVLKENVRTESTPDAPRATDQLGRVVFRLGGDEFVILLVGTKDQADVDAVQQRLHQELKKRKIKASMGGRPHIAGEAGEALLDSVDKMMYAQKRERKRRQKALEDYEARQQYRREVLALPVHRFIAHVVGRKLQESSSVTPPRAR
ncbi:MAG TPA: GGDEF domain-containing protein [Candidatus Saccharimonadales bacterium]